MFFLFSLFLSQSCYLFPLCLIFFETNETSIWNWFKENMICFFLRKSSILHNKIQHNEKYQTNLCIQTKIYGKNGMKQFFMLFGNLSMIKISYFYSIATMYSIRCVIKMFGLTKKKIKKWQRIYTMNSSTMTRTQVNTNEKKSISNRITCTESNEDKVFILLENLYKYFLSRSLWFVVSWTFKREMSI